MKKTLILIVILLIAFLGGFVLGGNMYSNEELKMKVSGQAQ